MQKTNMMKLKYLLCLIMMLGLAACTTTKLPEPVTPAPVVELPPVLTPQQLWQQHRNKLSKIVSFKVNGSMAYFSGKTKHYARFYLNQTSPTRYQLKLTTPLGATVMALLVKPNFVELTDQNGEKYQDNDVEALLFALTNMNIPLKSIHNWLIGLSNNPDQDIINDNGYLKETEFTQKNEIWKLKIPSYNTKNNIALPAQIQLTHNNELIRLKMNSWTLL